MNDWMTKWMLFQAYPQTATAGWLTKTGRACFQPGWSRRAISGSLPLKWNSSWQGTQRCTWDWSSWKGYRDAALSIAGFKGTTVGYFSGEVARKHLPPDPCQLILLAVSISLVIQLLVVQHQSDKTWLCFMCYTDLFRHVSMQWACISFSFLSPYPSLASS